MVRQDFRIGHTGKVAKAQSGRENTDGFTHTLKGVKMKVRLTFTEELLGTLAGNKDIATEFIASKAPGEPREDEAKAIENIDESLEKGSTIFWRDDRSRPFLWDYQIKGFFKDACSMLRRIPATKSSKLTAHRKVIDGLIFVGPRQIVIQVKGEIGICERPLRAETAQGPRIALCRSETAVAGSFIECEITCLDEKLEKVVAEWLNYGALRGLGQWRNSGKGRFSWKKVK